MTTMLIGSLLGATTATTVDLFAKPDGRSASNQQERRNEH
jgi:hypothetical protein